MDLSGSLQEQLAAKFNESPAEDESSAPTSDEGKLLRLLAKIAGLDVEEIDADATLADLGIDSLDRIELAVRVEEDFGVRIDELKMAEISTVDDALNALTESSS